MARPTIETADKKMVRGISLTDQQHAMLKFLSKRNGGNMSLTVQNWIYEEWSQLSDEEKLESGIVTETGSEEKIGT